MGQHINRSISEPIRQNLSWHERWAGPDQGLITCWEVGRELRRKRPELAEQAQNGELPVLGWKGGVSVKIEQDVKQGTLYYLAQWQGLRNEDLGINLDERAILKCAKTGQRVLFSAALPDGRAEEKLTLEP